MTKYPHYHVNRPCMSFGSIKNVKYKRIVGVSEKGGKGNDMVGKDVLKPWVAPLNDI